MTKKKRTVSKRYNKGTKKKNRTLKKKRRTLKKGGAADASTNDLSQLSKRQLRQRATSLGINTDNIQGALEGTTPKEDLIKLIVAAMPASERLQQLVNQPPVQQEIDISVDLNQLVIRFTFDRYAENMSLENLNSGFREYLTTELATTLINFTTVDIQYSEDKLRADVIIEKGQWVQGKKRYKYYKSFIQRKINPILRAGERAGSIDYGKIFNDTGVDVGVIGIEINEDWIQAEEERLREEAEEERQRLEREVEEERQRLIREAEEERVRVEREEQEQGRQQAVAIRLQKGFRDRKERRQREELEEQTRKATEIQARFRGRRDRRILESKRIFWIDETGEINTRVTEGIEGNYGVEILGSLNREETRIPIILKISDEVEVRGRWSGDSWKTGTVTSTDPSIKVRVNDVENFENWPIVRLKDPDKRNRIQEYITELEDYVDLVEPEELEELRDRINRSRLLLGEDIDCDFGKGNEIKCNLNPKCRYVSGNYGELNEGDCFTTEEIIQQLEPFIQELENDTSTMPSVETYDDNIRIYRELNKILKDTKYDENISQTEQKKTKFIEEEKKEGKRREKEERKEAKKQENIDRSQRIIKEREKWLAETKVKIDQEKEEDQKRSLYMRKKFKEAFARKPKEIEQVIASSKEDLKNQYLKYLSKEFNQTNDIEDLKKNYLSFVNNYYKNAIQKDKKILQQFMK